MPTRKTASDSSSDAGYEKWLNQRGHIANPCETERMGRVKTVPLMNAIKIQF